MVHLLIADKWARVGIRNEAITGRADRVPLGVEFVGQWRASEPGRTVPKGTLYRHERKGACGYASRARFNPRSIAGTAAGTLCLGTTKNDDGREVDLTDELCALLGAQVERVKGLERQLGRVVPYLFPHLRDARALNPAAERRAPGLAEPIRDFRRAWATTCRDAGVPGLLKRDLRRSAARRMVNLGMPERVAMTMTGHKTRAVFDR